MAIIHIGPGEFEISELRARARESFVKRDASQGSFESMGRTNARSWGNPRTQANQIIGINLTIIK